MSEWGKVLATSSLTVIVGVLIFAVTKLIERFVIDPLNEQSRVIGRIYNTLAFHANRYTSINAWEPVPMAETGRALRECACDLSSVTQAFGGIQY